MRKRNGKEVRVRLIHKGDKTYFGGIYNRCNGKIDLSKFSLTWDKVTCQRCLKKKGGPK